MNRKKAIIVACLLPLMSVSLYAGDLLTELGVQPGTPQARIIEKLKQELDVNKDGALDETEKEQLKKQFKERQQSVLQTQDKDNDGEISPEERDQFVSKIQKFRETILKMHDADGDGKLNDQERQKAQEWLSSHKQLPLL